MKPLCLREAEKHTEEVGIIQATYDILRRDNISLHVEGDYDRLKKHPNGILFVGDHKDQWEFVALTAMLHEMGRTDMRNIAKFYVKIQTAQAIGSLAAANIIPVYPRILARDRSRSLDSETVSRLHYRRSLLTLAESAEANSRAIAEASSYLSGGGVVNIFPCGSVVNARTHPWRQGVGQIIKQLPSEARQDVLITPYRLVDVSWARLLAAFAMRGSGIAGAPQTMQVQLGAIQTATALLNSLPEASHDQPQLITEQLRREFIGYFQEN